MYQCRADFDGYLGDVLVTGAFPPLHQDTATDDNPPCGKKSGRKSGKFMRKEEERRKNNADKKGKG